MTWLTWAIIITVALFVWFIVGLIAWLWVVKTLRQVNRAIEDAWDDPIYSDTKENE